jgi:hypothetical protein
MAIRVRTNNNTTTVRVGQQNAIKVIASNKIASAIAGDEVVVAMANIIDVDIDDRAVNTLLMYDGTYYVHVDPARIMDLADSVVDQAIDYGGF